jgi:hypothetical protein
VKRDLRCGSPRAQCDEHASLTSHATCSLYQSAGIADSNPLCDMHDTRRRGNHGQVHACMREHGDRTETRTLTLHWIASLQAVVCLEESCRSVVGPLQTGGASAIEVRPHCDQHRRSFTTPWLCGSFVALSLLKGYSLVLLGIYTCDCICRPGRSAGAPQAAHANQCRCATQASTRCSRRCSRQRSVTTLQNLDHLPNTFACRCVRPYAPTQARRTQLNASVATVRSRDTRALP